MSIWDKFLGAFGPSAEKKKAKKMGDIVDLEGGANRDGSVKKKEPKK